MALVPLSGPRIDDFKPLFYSATQYYNPWSTLGTSAIGLNKYSSARGFSCSTYGANNNFYSQSPGYSTFNSYPSFGSYPSYTAPAPSSSYASPQPYASFNPYASFSSPSLQPNYSYYSTAYSPNTSYMEPPSMNDPASTVPSIARTECSLPQVPSLPRPSYPQAQDTSFTVPGDAQLSLNLLTNPPPPSFNTASYNPASYNAASYNAGSYNAGSYNATSFNPASYNAALYNTASNSVGPQQTSQHTLQPIPQQTLQHTPQQSLPHPQYNASTLTSTPSSFAQGYLHTPASYGSNSISAYLQAFPPSLPSCGHTPPAGYTAMTSSAPALPPSVSTPLPKGTYSSAMYTGMLSSIYPQVNLGKTNPYASMVGAYQPPASSTPTLGFLSSSFQPDQFNPNAQSISYVPQPQPSSVPPPSSSKAVAQMATTLEPQPVAHQWSAPVESQVLPEPQPVPGQWPMPAEHSFLSEPPPSARQWTVPAETYVKSPSRGAATMPAEVRGTPPAQHRSAAIPPNRPEHQSPVKGDYLGTYTRTYYTSVYEVPEAEDLLMEECSAAEIARLEEEHVSVSVAPPAAVSPIDFARQFDMTID